jgi:hypothetical protein
MHFDFMWMSGIAAGILSMCNTMSKDSNVEGSSHDPKEGDMKLILKILAILILGPIALGLLVVLAAAAVVAGPMLLEKVKEFLGTSGPNTGPQPTT